MLRKDLERFVAGLGIGGQIGEDANEDENTDDENMDMEIGDGVDDGWEETLESGSSVVASDVEAEPEPYSRLPDLAPLGTSASNNSNGLVSNVPLRTMAI
jgi:hypothetical protein